MCPFKVVNWAKIKFARKTLKSAAVEPQKSFGSGTLPGGIVEG